jgi:hypothetical protein
VINPINYRIFLVAPVRFHDPDSALILKERCQVMGKIENIAISLFFNRSQVKGKIF